jgi:mRNA-degrading endonuclease RelE of RelBE toxin-antitoxin system
MEIKVLFSSNAAKEIRESHLWYEERSSGLGNLFVDIVDKTIQFLLMNPEGYPEKSPPYREIVLDKFPFVIIYEFDNQMQTIYVLHVFHTKRNPKSKYKP